MVYAHVSVKLTCQLIMYLRAVNKIKEVGTIILPNDRVTFFGTRDKGSQSQLVRQLT